MAADEWRLCVDWLVKVKILPDDHRATLPESQAFDLAQALRDGVLLCHLLNSLKPYSVDPKDFSPRPQLSQFLCLKNVRTFLQTCEKTFGVKNIDLFDPHDLFGLKNFRKVLHTLSKLSKTPLAETKGVRGFPPNNRHLYDHSYYNVLEDLAQGFPPHNNHASDGEEDIYGNLSDMAILNEIPEEPEVNVVTENIQEEKIYDDLCSLKRSAGSQMFDLCSCSIDVVIYNLILAPDKHAKHDLDDNDDLYDSVYQEDDEIYEDLCSTRRKRQERNSVAVGSSLPPPVTKRDYCIKEMVDTERNYVDALRMIVQDFIKPMKSVISQTDKDIIFSQIEKLQEVHTGFYADLQREVMSPKPQLHTVFINWKRKFLLYGDYCSNLPRAQDHIEELIKKSDVIKEKIEECERTANEARFRLRDLLHVPMQRVLKYHLLLRELIKNTDRKTEEAESLQKALEEMQDLSLYVNEVKRDNEALQLIQEIQNSIVDLQMPQNTSLKDYGRLQKDGELKVRSHVDNKVRPRYIFLFDKVMLMGKSKGETYSFKEAIVLAEFKVDASTSMRDGQRQKEKWNCSFQMVKQDQSLAYTFFAKTEDMKNKWIEAINLALDNTQPSAGKTFVMMTFSEPKICDICGKLLRGIFFQGYQCSATKICVHKECIGKKKQETPHPPPRKGERYKAEVMYNGLNPNPGPRRKPLKFQKDDIIDVTFKEADWWKGTVGNGQEGWFPQQLVIPFKQMSSVRGKRNIDSGYMSVVMRFKGSQRQPNVLPEISNKPKAPNFTRPVETHTSERGDSDTMDGYDWFVGPMPREHAAEKLKRLPDGSFLLRMSENEQRRGNPALSIKYSGTVRHIKIERNSENMFYMADTKYFHSLPELVEYYQANTLADSFPEVKTTLLYPFKTVCGNHPAANGIHSPRGASVSHPTTTDVTESGNRIISYATAVYDYAATETSQISLKTGDKVAVLSKTGSDKGWWKGEHCETHRVGYFPYAYVTEEEDD